MQQDKRAGAAEGGDAAAEAAVCCILQHNAAAHRVAEQHQWCVVLAALFQILLDEMVQIFEGVVFVGAAP